MATTMRRDPRGAKPKCGYIAITFFATARYGGFSIGFWGPGGG